MPSLLRAKYKHRGRNVNEGLDCWGLVVYMYRELLDVDLSEFEFEYDEQWKKAGLRLFDENKGKWKRVNRPDILDVVLFKDRNNVGYHCGVVLWDGKFIHATKKCVAVSSLSSWKDKIEGFYRYGKCTC